LAYKRDMSILKPSYIRAARALLDWNREELGKKAGLSPVTIANIELGKTDAANARTYDSITKAFLGAGVVFTEDGIEERKSWIKEFSGEDYFMDILDDIYNTLLDVPGAEVLTFGGDDRQNTPEIILRLRKIHNGGIKSRDMVEEGDTYLMGPVARYRWIPKEYFKNYIKVIYGNKICLDYGDRCILINNAEIAEVERNQFNLLWQLLPKIEVESTAHERI
jgi:transcriptional regulator with XRE-family HTH domain